jgi:hypothetical protein
MTSSLPQHGSQASVLSIEQSLRAAVPEAIFASSHVVRRIILADLDLPLLRTRMPHGESIVLSPTRLLELADDVWALPAETPSLLLLVARPDSEAHHQNMDGLLRAYWRLLTHGCIDLKARELLATSQDVSRRIAELPQLGNLQLAEARSVLTKEARLRDPSDSREVFAEFIATALELATFAPREFHAWFPSIDDPEGLVERLQAWVDLDAILARTRPALLATDDLMGIDESPSPPRRQPASRLSRRLTRRRRAVLRHWTGLAARRGNDVRAALLHWKLGALSDGNPVAAERARRGLARRAAGLVRRLDRAVGLGETTTAELGSLLMTLVEDAAGSAWSPAARLLYDLQKICVDSERESYRTQLLAWAFTFGRKRLIRPLPRQRTALIHRHVAAALRRLPSLNLSADMVEIGNSLLLPALETTAANVHSRLAPAIRHSLKTAGLVPRSLVEEVAFDKLINELVIHIANRGFESFGNVRDALSRSQIKLHDLQGLRELVIGDPLLKANRRLGRHLDGAYTRAPAYLSSMQRISAVAFGVPLGRQLTQHLLLPLGGAWVFWLALEHIVEPVTDYALGEPVRIYSQTGVLLTGIFFWLLMHRPSFRKRLLDTAKAVGSGLSYMLFALPQQLLKNPLVEQFLRSRPVRIVRRYFWSPTVFTFIVWLMVPQEGGWASRENAWLNEVIFCASFAVLNSPLGRMLEEQVLEGISRTIRQIHATLILGLLSWIVDLFRHAMGFIEGMLYAVDEQLRFRSDESRWALATKAVLTTLWTAVDWVIRFCVTLLIEPQLNPIKHFPVVTVSHKLLVPMIPMIAGQLVAATGMERSLALTAVTFVSTATPGVFGFLAWELKENWRLYAANRAQTLRPVQVGGHGESMRRLLVPGLHSGTLPKLYGKLRRQLRADRTGMGMVPADEALAELASDIMTFVQAECLGLLRRTRLFSDLEISVAEVRLATNRVVFTLAAPALAAPALRMSVSQLDGRLCCSLVDAGWMDRLSIPQRELLRYALTGLAALCGADETLDASEHGVPRPTEPIDWLSWQNTWEAHRRPHDQRTDRSAGPNAHTVGRP